VKLGEYDDGENDECRGEISMKRKEVKKKGLFLSDYKSLWGWNKQDVDRKKPKYVNFGKTNYLQPKF
jgi:hypothetical protein